MHTHAFSLSWLRGDLSTHPEQNPWCQASGIDKRQVLSCLSPPLSPPLCLSFFYISMPVSLSLTHTLTLLWFFPFFLTQGQINQAWPVGGVRSRKLILSFPSVSLRCTHRGLFFSRFYVPYPNWHPSTERRYVRLLTPDIWDNWKLKGGIRRRGCCCYGCTDRLQSTNCMGAAKHLLIENKVCCMFPSLCLSGTLPTTPFCLSPQTLIHLCSLGVDWPSLAYQALYWWACAPFGPTESD